LAIVGGNVAGAGCWNAACGMMQQRCSMADDRPQHRRRSMRTFVTALVGQRKNVRIIMAAALMAAVGGWAISAIQEGNAAAAEGLFPFNMARKNDMKLPPLEEIKRELVGSYAVTGTDPDGMPYAGARILDIALAPSGALELDWDNGKQVGIGQIIGNILAVASLTKGRTGILIMTINPDGSLSGKWSRRTDRGYKGTESWKKT
jgi:hypothetical protein